MKILISLILFVSINSYAGILEDKKLEAVTLFKSLKDYVYSAAIKAGTPYTGNPAAWVDDNCVKVNTIAEVDSCLVILNNLNSKVPEVKAEIAAEKASINTCGVDVNSVQSFDVDSIDTMNTTQLKNVIKIMAKIIKCRIK